MQIDAYEVFRLLFLGQCHLVNGTGRREEHKMLRHHAFARVP